MNHAGAEFWTISFRFSKMHIIILSVLHILMRSMPVDSCHVCCPCFISPHSLWVQGGPQHLQLAVPRGIRGRTVTRAFHICFRLSIL